MSDAANKDNADHYKVNNSKTTRSRSFEYETKIIGSIPANNNRLNSEVVVPIHYLSNFWRSLDLPLINCEIQLDFSWSKNCRIFEISRTPEVAGNSPKDETLTTGAAFQIKNAKLYVPIVTLPINDNIKILENKKQVFQRLMKSNRIK